MESLTGLTISCLVTTDLGGMAACLVGQQAPATTVPRALAGKLKHMVTQAQGKILLPWNKVTAGQTPDHRSCASSCSAS